MKALSKLKPEPGIWMVDVPEPELHPHQLRVKIKKTAICGTDIHIYKWDEWAQNTVPTPMVVGHEFAGEVVEVGSQAKGFKVGDRISGEGHLTCGHCRNCREGGAHLCPDTIGIGYDCPGCFGEYLTIPASNAIKLPAAVSDETAAILDPFGNATHATLAFDLVGEDVLITGAGPIGMMSAAIAKHCGARNIVVTDVNNYRLELAYQMGANRVVNIAREDLKDVIPELGMVSGFDIGLEMSGNPQALHQMIDHMYSGGRISLLGIPPSATAIDWNQVIFKCLTFQGIYGRQMYSTWYKMLSMLDAGLDLSPIITHIYPVDDFQKGFDVMCSGESGKVILNWTN